MAMISADDTVAQLTMDINDKQYLLEAVIHLQLIYPELLIERDNKVTSFSSVRFSAASANKLTSDIEIVINDSELPTGSRPLVEAWPYTTIDGYKVYSNPPCFVVGEVNDDGFGMVPHSSWEDTMEEADIPNSVIRKVRLHIKQNPPISYNK